MMTAVVLASSFIVLTLVGWALIFQGKTWFVRRSARVADEVGTGLADLFIFINTSQVAMLSAVAVVAIPLVVFAISGNVVLTVVTIPLSLLAPRFLVRRMQRKRLLAIEKQLPDALLMVSGALRAGASFPVALESAAQEVPPPISQELALLIREVRLGVDMADALQHMEKRLPMQDFLMATAAISIAREVGGNLAETLETVARTLRDKQQMEGKIRSLTAQGKAQGLVMTLLPVFLIVVLAQMEPVAMAPLFDKPIGWATLTVIFIMELLGYRSISKITNIDV
ncbi:MULTISPECIES: type II secretion system F family protein [Pandoraea]|jgi:tight adherence protein B|uniref:Flp pilus assembly protein TadB n=1 Tax=Pandoraea pnomenusa TaxID=93220 RepID=A0A378YCZ5_9BURK|nr:MULTISPECIES: type II secretion system F family protein [Pandoraea]AHB05928.1 secretion system protein F [Pandoraea pnomenusa 3kgm]AHB78003.1 secretion system protein F [Pandoraea pnomenusa]AHN73702.1 secretion system protein F [Pandoraea pnomenusa]AIU25545.1 secretion system protein F [Pandoraea pnomenusa]ANC46681.1 secretion system protein F [Pandoraea pnomenusa]